MVSSIFQPLQPTMATKSALFESFIFQVFVSFVPTFLFCVMQYFQDIKKYARYCSLLFLKLRNAIYKLNFVGFHSFFFNSGSMNIFSSSKVSLYITYQKFLVLNYCNIFMNSIYKLFPYLNNSWINMIVAYKMSVRECMEMIFFKYLGNISKSQMKSTNNLPKKRR